MSRGATGSPVRGEREIEEVGCGKRCEDVDPRALQGDLRDAFSHSIAQVADQHGARTVLDAFRHVVTLATRLRLGPFEELDELALGSAQTSATLEARRP